MRLDLLERLFRPGWYRAENPDVAHFAGTPFEHYSCFGWRDGREVHPLFDRAYYLAQSPDCVAEDDEPLSHYLTVGWRALRSPHPGFDPIWYLRHNPEVLLMDRDPWLHYIDEGWRRGASPHPLFDTPWYLASYPDVAAADLEPLDHYLRVGWKERRSPHPLFSGQWYSEAHGLDDRQNPWLHYITTGWRAGLAPNVRFDSGWYHDQYLDAWTPLCDPLVHYLEEGWRAGFLPHPEAVGENGAEEPGSGPAAPLYLELTDGVDLTPYQGAGAGDQPGHQDVLFSGLLEQAASVLRAAGADLRASSQRGRILLVTHDLQLGGAQTVLRLFADWLLSSSRFSVGIVAVKGGRFRRDFEQIAPVFVLEEHPEARRAAALADWAGEGDREDAVKAVFVNSVASGSFLKYWRQDCPSVAFIHELPQILAQYADEVDLVRSRCDHVVCGGPDVYAALGGEFGFDPARLTSAYSFIEARPPEEDAHARQRRRREARAGLGVAESRILVMGCGVLHWRKSPDKFIETAQEVLAAGLDAEFVWLGGGSDLDACLEQVRAAGLEERVRFTGYEPDVAGKLAAADIFLLSSQEDPFPLVALYAAQAGAALVCFKDAGGIADFVQTGSGTAVEFMNIAAMSEAVLAYGRDAELRARTGKIGREQVARKHTVNAVGPLLLDRLRQVAGLAPEVSVVLPNYNYEAYLPQRLDSIVAQSFQDFELILLDDASPDGSAAILRDFAKTRAATQVVINQENSGSPFVQWLKGMELARAEVIWLAEADDWCEPELLATLLPRFDNRNLRLASAASVPVRADGSVIGNYSDLYLDRINPGRWRQDFTATDHEEACQGLGIANTIPNASAVLMRRFNPDPAFVAAVSAMRLCGDWYFYIRAMKGGEVGFSATPLNYHRRHDSTVTNRLEGSQRYFEELAEVRGYVARTYVQDGAAQERIGTFLEQDLTRFGVADRGSLPPVAAPAKALPTLAVIAPDLSPGGGQMFAVSLANEWHRRGGRVVLVNADNQPSHPAVVAKLSSEVALFETGDAGFDLAQIVQRYDVDLIHSNIWWADSLVDSWRDHLPAALPWVVTMHGCHETLLKHPGIDRGFVEKMTRMIARVDAWVYLADKNIAVFDQLPRPERLLCIPNGMAEEPINVALNREDLGLRAESVVFCLAARGIASKGWHAAVGMIAALNAEGHAADLILCGEGPAAEDIRAQAPAHVVLTGQVSNVQDYFALADVGILPSTFVGESLPLSLIEMTAKGLPLIASDLGEIPSIIGQGETAAGLLVPVQWDPAQPSLDMAAFLAAARQLMDADLRAQMGANAQARFAAEFRIDRMVDRYSALYEDLGAADWKQTRWK